MSPEKVTIVQRIMDVNDKVALENQKILDDHHIFGINIMASPGAGKTSTILQTITRLEGYKTGVLEGDTAPVTIDADKIQAIGSPAVQINTGGECHLDAMVIQNGLSQLPLDEIDLLIIENVGNLICPAGYKLGTHANVLIASIPEGDDKPYKYPNIYRGLDVLLLNKIDLLPYVPFDIPYFIAGVRMLNPDLKVFELSSKTGEGFDAWIDWLKGNLTKQ